MHTPQSNETVIAQGSVTQANMRLSLATNTAFVDFSAAGTLTPYLGHKVRIKDSAGRSLVGYIKASGTGEGVGGELVDGWTNGTTNPYETFTPGAGSDITLSNSSGAGSARKTLASATASGGLYKLVATIALTSGAAGQYLIGNGEGFGGTGISFSTALATTTGTYRVETGSHTDTGFYNAVAGNFSVAGFSLKQVTSPSATGVTITSTKGGSTFNWAAETTGFNRNDASGYTYSIIKVHNAILVASGSVTQANNRLSTVATGAFWWAEGTDLSAYAGGQHLLALYDSSNRALLAFTGAAGAGEGLDLDKVDVWANYITSPYDTFTPGAGSDVLAVSDGTGASIASKATAATLGALYKQAVTVLVNSGTGGTFYFASSAGLGGASISFGTGTSTGRYRTAAAAYTHFGFQNLNTVAGNFNISGHSLKQVLTPSASGFALRNASGLGGAQSVLSETTGFNRNDSSGYTYKIFYIGA